MCHTLYDRTLFQTKLKDKNIVKLTKNIFKSRLALIRHALSFFSWMGLVLFFHGDDMTVHCNFERHDLAYNFAFLFH